MSATKMLWGQVITVFLIVLAAVWGATQWTAAALAYQPELGPPWFADNILSALATIGLALRIKCVPAIVVVTPERERLNNLTPIIRSTRMTLRLSVDCSTSSARAAR